jgi:hypothetical protein
LLLLTIFFGVVAAVLTIAEWLQREARHNARSVPLKSGRAIAGTAFELATPDHGRASNQRSSVPPHLATLQNGDGDPYRVYRSSAPTSHQAAAAPEIECAGAIEIEPFKDVARLPVIEAARSNEGDDTLEAAAHVVAEEIPEHEEAHDEPPACFPNASPAFIESAASRFRGAKWDPSISNFVDEPPDLAEQPGAPPSDDVSIKPPLAKAETASSPPVENSPLPGPELIAELKRIVAAAASEATAKASPAPAPPKDTSKLDTSKVQALPSSADPKPPLPRAKLIAELNRIAALSPPQAQAKSPPVQVPSSAAPAPTPSKRGRWIPPGETVTIAGFTFSDGMVYVGRTLPVRYGQDDNCLINPEKLVAHSGSDWTGQTMSYWPSYSEITSSARRAYLEWLAGGRSDPYAYIGYVFLFFYGLERRLFVDEAHQEIPTLKAEVERLLSIYGDNHSFDGYARRYLEFAELLRADPEPPQPNARRSGGFEIPVAVRLHIGRKLKRKEHIEAHDALLWALSLPDTYPRTPVLRCFERFQDLWGLRFNERYQGGLAVRAPERPIAADYRPASGCFSASIAFETLPDIAEAHLPADRLRELVHACTEELEAYSRFVGRKPEATDSVEALLLLPPRLTEASETLVKLRTDLDARFENDDVALMATREVAGLLSLELEDGERLSLGRSRQLATLLDRLGIGFEPDRRSGPTGAATNGKVALFKSAATPPEPDDAVLKAARTMVEIAALAAHADGVIVPVEYEAIQMDLKAFEGLGDSDRLRMSALALALLNDPPKQQAATNRLLKLPMPARRRAAASAVSAVLADGKVTAAEVHFLERLHKALGFPKEDVYTMLHRGGVEADEPARVAPERHTPGVAIPPPADSVVIAFDERRLQRIKQETEEVSRLLAGIFVEEEQAPAPVERTSVAASGAIRFSGLDAAHGTLLSTILRDGLMERPAFEEVARGLKLLPDGAIETINEWGFEQFDEPVLDDAGASVATFAHLKDQVQAMGAQA